MSLEKTYETLGDAFVKLPCSDTPLACVPYQSAHLPPITIRMATPSANDGGATVVTLTLNGAKSSATRDQISLILVSSAALNDVGLLSRSYAGELMLENDPQEA